MQPDEPHVAYVHQAYTVPILNNCFVECLGLTGNIYLCLKPLTFGFPLVCGWCGWNKHYCCIHHHQTAKKVNRVKKPRTVLPLCTGRKYKDHLDINISTKRFLYFTPRVSTRNYRVARVSTRHGTSSSITGDQSK